MSFHNHKLNYTDKVLAAAEVMLADDPDFEGRIDRADPDPAKHFHDWITGEEDHIGDPACGFWHMERSYWEARNDPDVLLVHYADLKKDLTGEMRRIADFLEIEVAENLWPELVQAAGFDSMKEKTDELLPTAGDLWEGGGNTFLHKGTNGRWRETVNSEDLQAYERKVKQEFSPELAQWIEFGRLE